MDEAHSQKQIPTCPLCGNDNPKKHPHYAKLYGHYVCRKCYHGFANRRQFAFLIDAILWGLLYRFVEWGIVSALKVFDTPMELINTALHILLWVYGATFLLKDGFRGMSPGKAAMGVLVIDKTTSEPAGRMASSRRNLPLVVPLAFIFIGFQLVKGYRWGDKWANTKVIWKKYRDTAPFKT